MNVVSEAICAIGTAFFNLTGDEFFFERTTQDSAYFIDKEGITTG
jgi:hypothetical protein